MKWHPLSRYRVFPLSALAYGGRQHRCGAALPRCPHVKTRQLRRAVTARSTMGS